MTESLHKEAEETQPKGEGCGNDWITAQRSRRDTEGRGRVIHKGAENRHKEGHGWVIRKKGENRHKEGHGWVIRKKVENRHKEGCGWVIHKGVEKRHKEECGWDWITTQRSRRHRPWERGVAASLHKGSDDTDHGRGVWLHHYTKAQTTQTMGEGCGCITTQRLRWHRPWERGVAVAAREWRDPPSLAPARPACWASPWQPAHRYGPALDLTTGTSEPPASVSLRWSSLCTQEKWNTGMMDMHPDKTQLK